MFKLFTELTVVSFTIGIITGYITEEKQTPPTPIAVPIVTVEIEPLPLIAIRKPIDYDEKQKHCLALNVYHEAKNQDLQGQVAVAMVTLNRVQDKRFPDTICNVVKHTKYPGRLHKCQFSWWCDGKSDKPKEQSAWKTALSVAKFVLENWSYRKDPTGGALWYHANYVKPRWSKAFNRVAVIQDHIFYAEK